MKHFRKPKYLLENQRKRKAPGSCEELRLFTQRAFSACKCHAWKITSQTPCCTGKQPVPVCAAAWLHLHAFIQGVSCVHTLCWTVYGIRQRYTIKSSSESSAETIIKELWCWHSSYSPAGSRGSAGAYRSSFWVKGRGTPWTGRQSIAGPHIQTHNHSHTTGNLKLSINLTCMSLDCGRKSEYPEETPGTGRTCKLHTERPLVRFVSGTFLLWRNSADHRAAHWQFRLFYFILFI